MANIKQVFECPHCQASLIGPNRPQTCPACKYDFGEATGDFKYPLTLSEQQERISNKIMHYEAILDMPVIKANFIMNDALNIIETIAAKNVRASDIRPLVLMAIKIGQIATQYDGFIEAGGKHVPSLFFKEGDGNELPKTGDGEKPS